MLNAIRPTMTTATRDQHQPLAPRRAVRAHPSTPVPGFACLSWPSASPGPDPRAVVSWAARQRERVAPQALGPGAGRNPRASSVGTPVGVERSHQARRDQHHQLLACSPRVARLGTGLPNRWESARIDQPAHVQPLLEWPAIGNDWLHRATPPPFGALRCQRVSGNPGRRDPRC